MVVTTTAIMAINKRGYNNHGMILSTVTRVQVFLDSVKHEGMIAAIVDTLNPRLQTLNPRLYLPGTIYRDTSDCKQVLTLAHGFQIRILTRLSSLLFPKT